MNFSKLVPIAFSVGLGVAACGSASDGPERFDFGPTGGVAQGCIAPSCGTCQTCISQCLCAGAPLEQCAAQCEGAVAGPQDCSQAQGCFDVCFCNSGDAALCEFQCRTPEPPPPATPPPGQPPPPAQPPVSAGCGGDDGSGWDGQWQSFECEVLNLTNQRRAQGGNCGGQQFGPSGPLEMQAQLRQSARGHSADMANQGFFDHNNPHTGTNPFQRMQAAGFQGQTMGENIAAGQPSPQSVVDGWMNSPGHCKNILNGGFRFIGIGYFFSPTDQYRHMWTQNFGG